MAERYEGGYLRECAHATGDVTLCARCLMREADLIDAKMRRTLEERVDLRASILKARHELRQTQAGVARAMGMSPANLCRAKRGQRPLPATSLKWLTQQGFLVERRSASQKSPM